MEGNRHPSGKFRDSETDDDIEISAQPYGMKTHLKQDRMEIDEKEDGRTYAKGSQRPNGIGSEDWVGDDTRTPKTERNRWMKMTMSKK